jgi:hypothetical protein
MADLIRCAICGEVVKYSSFEDTKSRKEFFISGLCQTCQNQTFSKSKKLIRWCRSCNVACPHTKTKGVPKCSICGGC